MVKKKTAVKKNARKGQRPRPKGGRTAGLDLHGAAYARLLRDPCNAPLVAPVYMGAGSGNYVRVRKILTPLVDSNTSLQFGWDPATNAAWYGQGIGGAVGSIGQADPLITHSLGNIWKQFRCMAACVKVRYVGPEMDRAGVVGLLCAPPMFTPLATGVSSSSILGSCACIHRVGDVLHEVKWVPDNDVSWTKATSVFDPTSFGNDNTLQVVIDSAVPNSIMLECTVVYEVAYQATAGMVSTAQISKSRNTFNQVAQALGEPVSWLYSNVIAPGVKSIAMHAAQTTLSGISAASVRAAPLLLTL